MRGRGRELTRGLEVGDRGHRPHELSVALDHRPTRRRPRRIDRHHHRAEVERRQHRGDEVDRPRQRESDVITRDHAAPREAARQLQRSRRERGVGNAALAIEQRDGRGVCEHALHKRTAEVVGARQRMHLQDVTTSCRRSAGGPTTPGGVEVRHADSAGGAARVHQDRKPCRVAR